MVTFETDILIIGGGLSGLALASQLAVQGRNFLLLEARDRLGGRILRKECSGGHFDLGPAWFWPGQPRIAALIQQLGLTRFDQYANGDVLFEDERGLIQRGRGFASMEGSYRLSGGFGSLIDALSQGLDQQRLKCSSPVASLRQIPNGVEAKTEQNEVIVAKRCVLALPPRLAAEMTFAPELPDAAIQAMTAVPTWMAGHAKAVAIYDRPFWRDAGLSGDAMSRHGPLAEIHDASPADKGTFALFGFVGVPAQARQDEPALRRQIIAQLGRLFGQEADPPTEIILKDWSLDRFTATKRDLQPLYSHPRYGLPPALSQLWDGRLLFAGTEVAPQFGGYIEGALEAAEATLEMLVEEDA